MKRVWCIWLVCLIVCACSLTASAEASLIQTTEFVYTSMQTGGKDGMIVYTAYEASGALAMGTLTADGEQTRTAYSFDGWNALFEEPLWQTTVHGDGTALCPYAASHKSNTVCPYMELNCVTLTNTENGVTLENYYIPSGVSQTLPGGTVHFCIGRYGYKAAETLRRDEQSRYTALKNENGLWGVFDGDTGEMVTDFLYEDMSAVYGTYAKVYNGTAWARMDVSGRFPTGFLYESDTAFSVKEEVREIAAGQWQVFSKDNEAVSFVLTGSFDEVTYEPTTGLLFAVAADGTKTAYDLNGSAVAQFAATDTVRFLQDTCYAVERYVDSGALEGVALWNVTEPLTSLDTVTKGDVNFDGKRNSTDARLMLQTVVDQRTLTERQLAAADINNTDTVEAMDIRDLFRMVFA